MYWRWRLIRSYKILRQIPGIPGDPPTNPGTILKDALLYPAWEYLKKEREAEEVKRKQRAAEAERKEQARKEHWDNAAEVLGKRKWRIRVPPLTNEYRGLE